MTDNLTPAQVAELRQDLKNAINFARAALREQSAPMAPLTPSEIESLAAHDRKAKRQIKALLAKR